MSSCKSSATDDSRPATDKQRQKGHTLNISLIKTSWTPPELSITWKGARVWNTVKCVNVNKYITALCLRCDHIFVLCSLAKVSQGQTWLSQWFLPQILMQQLILRLFLIFIQTLKQSKIINIKMTHLHQKDYHKALDEQRRMTYLSCCQFLSNNTCHNSQCC